MLNTTSSMRRLQFGFCIVAVNWGCVFYLSDEFEAKFDAHLLRSNAEGVEYKLTWLTKKVILWHLRTERYKDIVLALLSSSGQFGSFCICLCTLDSWEILDFLFCKPNRTALKPIHGSKKLCCEDDHTLCSSTKVMNVWRYASTTPCSCMVWCFTKLSVVVLITGS